MELKKIVKNIIPPFIYNFLEKKVVNRKYGWHGDYSSWEDAKSHCKGYDSDEIINKVRASLLMVKNGDAVYERDGVLFNEIEYSWPVLSGLLWVAAQNNGRLNVLDFGGSLGSSYFQNKKFLDNLSDVKWNIVEQEKFVEIGKKDFQDETLRFYHNIDDCLKENKTNVVLLSSVLQYIEKPFELIQELMSIGSDALIIDLTGFTILDRDIITVQNVDPNIYAANYPCWIFSDENFFKYIKNSNYSVLKKFDSYIGAELYIYKKIQFYYKGFILTKDTL